MTFGAIYTSSEVHDKICKIAAQKYDCDFDAVGMVWPGKEQVPNKNNKDEVKEVMCFYIFDKSLEKVGTVYRSEVRKYANGKSKEE